MIFVAPVHLAVYRNGVCACFTIIVFMTSLLFVLLCSRIEYKQFYKMTSECDNEEAADIVETKAADSDNKTKTVSRISSFILSFEDLK